MKNLLIGLILAINIALITAIVFGTEYIATITGGIGLLFGVAVIALSRAVVNGDRTHANYATENKRDRDERLRTIRITLFVGLPCILIALIFKYLFLF